MVWDPRSRSSAVVATSEPSSRPRRSRVVTAIQGLLLDPMMVKAAVREHQALSADRRRKAHGERQAWDRELGEVKRRALRLVDQVAEGELSGTAVKDRLA